MACACVEKLQSLCLRLKLACRHHSRLGKSKGRSIKISDPFDFKHISGVPEGVHLDDIISGPPSVRDTHLLICRRVNVLREKAAASRMVAIEDQPPSRAGSATGVVFGGHHHRLLSETQSAFGGIPRAHAHQVKSRVGYRGLASSSAVISSSRGTSYAALMESRPSVSRSFGAVADGDMAGSLSPTTSLSSMGSGVGRMAEMRGRSM